MTYGQHLHRSRHGILYFRYVIPRDLRSHLGRTEVRVSLHASSKREAEPIATELKILMRRAIDATRNSQRMGTEDPPNLHAIRRLVDRRQIDALRKELEDADTALAAKGNEIEALKAKLLATIDGRTGSGAGTGATPRLSEAITAFKAERAAQGAWTKKTAAMWDTLLIAKLDRLARNVRFVSELMEGQVPFVACDMPQANRFVLHIMAAVAEHEAAAISTRTKDALAAARARGVRLGTAGVANAREANAKRRDEATARAEQMRNQIDELLREDLTLSQIGGTLELWGFHPPGGGKWHRVQVARVLSRLRVSRDREETP